MSEPKPKARCFNQLPGGGCYGCTHLRLGGVHMRGTKSATEASCSLDEITVDLSSAQKNGEFSEDNLTDGWVEFEEKKDPNRGW